MNFTAAKKIDILFLSQGSDFYGSNIIMLEAAKHLKKRGYNIHIIFPNHGPIIREFDAIKISSEILNLGILRRKYVNLFGLINRGYFLLIALLKLFLFIKKHKIELVYSNGLGVIVGFFVAQLTRKKHLWHIHEIIQKPKFFYVFYRIILNLDISYKIAVSEAVRLFWSKNRSKKFSMIYNGIPSTEILVNNSKLRNELEIPPSVLLIGMIGRVSYLKGQEYFIRICHELLKHKSNLKFIMVGDVYSGNEQLYQDLIALKERLGVSSSIIDLGYRRDITNILAALDLFILPSILPDSFPTVILEAMGQGKAIVSTRQGGALEMLEDKISGTFIPINDEKAASNIIIPLLNDQKLRTEMGYRARKKVLMDFSSEKFQKNLIELIDTIYHNY